MANCEFPAGLGHVSGTLSKTIMRTSKGVVTRRIVAQVRNGKQKVYIRDEKPRRKPVSEHEKQIRLRFKEAGERAALLSEEQKKQYAEEWSRSNFMFNGKKYCTIRGYIMARIYAEITAEQTQTGGNT